MERYEIKHQPMKNGVDEARKRVYKKIETEHKIWYIACQENAGDDLYVFIKNENPTNSFKGFGGGTLYFELEDGVIDAVKGPWHSNCRSLLEDTGIDLTQTALTFGVIGKERNFGEKYETYIDDLLYKDDDWTIGDFNRIKNKAQKFADELNIKVWYYSQSQGGSTTAWLDPTGVVIPFKPIN